MLDALGFQLTAPTPKLFFRRFLRAAAADLPRSQIAHLSALGSYFLELAMVSPDPPFSPPISLCC